VENTLNDFENDGDIREMRPEVTSRERQMIEELTHCEGAHGAEVEKEQVDIIVLIHGYWKFYKKNCF